MSADEVDDERRGEADERSAGDVAGIVEADEDPRDRDDRGGGEEERAHAAPTDERDRKGDREGGDRVIARERGLVRRGRQEEGLRRMRLERSLPHPEVRDHLGREEPEARRDEPGEARDLPAIPRAWPVEEPEGQGCDDEERDGPIGDEVLDLVTKTRMTAEGPVQEVKDGPVDPLTIVDGSAKRPQ